MRSLRLGKPPAKFPADNAISHLFCGTVTSFVSLVPNSQVSQQGLSLTWLAFYSAVFPSVLTFLPDTHTLPFELAGPYKNTCGEIA